MLSRLKQQGALLLLTLLIGAVSYAFAVKAYRELRFASHAKAWPTTEAIVLDQSQEDRVFVRQESADATVWYGYTVDEVEYEGIEHRDNVPVARADELTDAYPGIVAQAKEGEEDSISAWFSSEHTFVEFRNRGATMVDLVVDKLES